VTRNLRDQATTTQDPLISSPKTRPDFSDGGTFIGERAIFNTETKEIKEVDIRRQAAVSRRGQKGHFDHRRRVNDSKARSRPRLGQARFPAVAKTMRIYQEDRVIFQNVTFYVKNVPLFWWPYLYQSLDESFSYMISPLTSVRGGHRFSAGVTMPITEDIKGVFRLDYRYRRGVASDSMPVKRVGQDATL